MKFSTFVRRNYPGIRQSRRPADFGYITETRAGKYLGRKLCSNVQKCAWIKRLPDEVDLFTGEVKQPYIVLRTKEKRYCERKDSREANPRGVRAACNSFKWKIRANEDRIKLFVTLTYRDNMTDVKKLYADFSAWWKKVKRAFPYVKDYLVAFEPQERGAWHAHVLLLSGRNRVFIPNKLIARLWGHGFTKTQGIGKIRKIAEYLTAYLTNLKDGKKGARLTMYPRGFHFCRYSSGITRPVVSKWRGMFNRLPNVSAWELLFDHSKARKVSSSFTLFSRCVLLQLKYPLDPWDSFPSAFSEQGGGGTSYKLSFA